MGSAEFWGWATFAILIAAFLALDMFAHRGDHVDNRKRAIFWSILSVSLGFGFAGYVWYDLGPVPAQEYVAAYLLEECLSLDNLFVFLIVFRMMQIPKAQQRTALTWGILGALVFRGIFIFVGVEALERWEWVELIFALLLLYGAWHAFRENPSDDDEENKLIRWLTRHLRVSQPQSQPHFIVREAGRLKATPLLVAIMGLEATDVLFAIDSVPAAFSVTRDQFIIYSSNVFAILGLRSLYVVLAHTIAELKFLHYGLAAVLAFAGGKMIAAYYGYHISPLISVGVIIALIGAAVVASLVTSPPRNSSSPQPPGV